MKTIEAYQTSDGDIFDDERKAKAHQQNIIGELLDRLIPHDSRGNITRTDRHSQLMALMNDVELKVKINALYKAVNHNDDE